MLARSSGAIYQLAPTTGGAYTESLLYSFGDLAETSTPNGSLAMDSSGALYGVTSLGGTFNNGTVYQFVPASNGQFATESLLFSFKAGTKSGSTPSGSLLFDRSGNLHGVTNGGGSGNDDGVVMSSHQPKQPGPRPSFTSLANRADHIRSGDSPGIQQMAHCTAPLVARMQKPLATDRYSNYCPQPCWAGHGRNPRRSSSPTPWSVAT
jgi:hypothetical protein